MDKLLQLADGTLVEVQATEQELAQVSGRLVDKVATSLDAIGPLLFRIGRIVADAWKPTPGTPLIDCAAIEFGLSFEGEGNVFITKAKAGANITVSITYKQAPPAG